MKHIRFDGADEKPNKSSSLAQKVASRSSEDDFIYSETKKWYHELPEEPSSSTTFDAGRIDSLKKEATSILHGDSTAYEAKLERTGSSDQRWARSLLSKGAIGDRVAAATILIQDSPVYNLGILRNLVSMVKPAKKKDSLTVIETLSELFLNDLLLPEAKLRRFDMRPHSELDTITSGNRERRKKILALWEFEDQLKEVYGEFIKALNTFAHDTIESHKEKAISVMSKLLMHNPEFEKVLLSNIVNKLGDPSRKVASKVIYHLCQVLYNHPNMKNIILNEIEKMLFRPNISPKAQYYGVCFLNQFYLTKDDNKVAENLVRVYFSFFKACIKKGDIDTRLMSAILTGVKRCQPYLDMSKVEEIQSQADALHRLIHLARYNIALHALALLFQISPLTQQLSDRYYCALYKKLGDSETLTTTLPALLMNLIYRSINIDKNQSRVLAFLKRLLQLACMSDAARACGFLLLIGRLTRSKKLPLEWLTKLDDDDVTQEETKLNADESVTIDESAEDKEKVDTLPQMLWKGDKMDLLDDDGDEVYHDAILEEDEGEYKKKLKKRLNRSSTTGWTYRNDPTSVESTGDDDLKIMLKKAKNLEKTIDTYTPYSRNPAYCGAEHSVFSELLPLLNHFHPTVRIFAQQLVDRDLMHYTGDPLKDFSIARFLDRFAFKNPKKDPANDPETESKVKHIKGSHPKFAQRQNYQPGGLKSLPVLSSAYLNEDSAHIPPDERFLFDYLQMQKHKYEKDSDDESDAGSIGSVEFEDYLENIGKSRKRGNESDDELDFVREMMSDKKNKKKKESDESDGEDDGDDMSDDEIDEEMSEDDGGLSDGDGDDAEGLDEDFDIEGSGGESDLDFSDDGDDEGFDIPNKSKSNKKSVKGGVNSMFASAEEFSTLLEDTGADKAQGTSQAVANTDNAHMKQLDWETKRDRWVKGYKKQDKWSKGKDKGSFKKSFGKKNHGNFKPNPNKGKRSFNDKHKSAKRFKK